MKQSDNHTDKALQWLIATVNIFPKWLFRIGISSLTLSSLQYNTAWIFPNGLAISMYWELDKLRV